MKVETYMKKSLSSLKAITQRNCNAYIRKRDEGLPCISCNKYKQYMDAGHFIPIGSLECMRFVEENIHAQCTDCNQWLGGCHKRFEQGLINRYGQEYVDRLREMEMQFRRSNLRWDKAKLVEINLMFLKKFKELSISNY